MKSIAVAGLLTLLLAFAGCASSSRAGADSSRLYAADMATTIEAVGEALLGARLNIEDEQWIVPEAVYQVDAYEQARVFNSVEGTVHTADIQIRVSKAGEGETRVEMISSRNRGPSIASSAGRTVDHMRSFFDLLGEKLPDAPEE